VALHHYAQQFLHTVSDCETRDRLSLKRAVAPEQEWRVRGHELEVACASLPPKYRSAFEFIFIDGRSYEEAADHFHCPIGTIKSRVNRARRHLMIELEVPG
jgi:RNA polymerase sigma-70 factor (ECF subfamily)